LEAIATIRQRGHHRVVVKKAHGLAGQSTIRLLEPEILEAQRHWLANAVARGPLIVEPWLERELDFSIQLEMRESGLKLCGYTGLINDASGQFRGNWAESHHHRRVPARILSLFQQPADIARRLRDLYEDLFTLLEGELQRLDYQGPIGIDALVYRTPGGGCRLKPIVEINPRYTMGRLTVELMRQTCPGSSGLFRLVNRAEVRREGFENFADYANALGRQHPLHLAGQPALRIREGAVCLNDPEAAQVCLATFKVSGPTSDESLMRCLI
jgi:hypothetical protein